MACRQKSEAGLSMTMAIAKSRVTLRKTTLKRSETINCHLAEQSQQNTMWHFISCCN